MIKRFLSYVEITTKITSIFAFLFSLAYLFYIKQSINWSLTLLFLFSMFLFDLTTTAINNYIDTKTNHQKLQFKRKTAFRIIIILFTISIISGLYLAYLTDIIVLLVGGICFLCGLFYTYGPIPISRQPLGELFSGIFYGLFIPFIIFYINMPEKTYIIYQLNFETISIIYNIKPLLTLFLLSIIPICTTANIMLANNICDLEKDIAVKRYTLPYYIGDKALLLFPSIYYLTYPTLILMVCLKILNPICLIYLLNIFIVQKNINNFLKRQEKSTTFIYSIKNYLIIMSSVTILIFISGLIP